MSEARGPNPPDADDDPGAAVYLFDLVSSAGAVIAVGLLLFAISGVWPPLVAIESGSMEPHIDTGDLVFVMDEDRFAGEGAYADTGVVPANRGAATRYTTFQQSGDVIVFQPDGEQRTTPVIHRAMFWVNESENWYDKADKQSLGRYSACGNSTDEALPNCPAPHAGFITKGDANGRYDQVIGHSGIVQPDWIVGTGEVAVPWFGNVRPLRG